MPVWLRRVFGTGTGRFAVIVVVIVAVTALLALVWTPFDPSAADVRGRWAPPSWPHVLGTDGTGRDILSLIMAGARTTVFVSIGAGVVATLVGVALAALGALTARWMRKPCPCSSTSSSLFPC